MRLLQILIFLISYNVAFGQVEKESFWKRYVEDDLKQLELVSFDSLRYKKMYRIWNAHQVVELKKTDDSTYNGQLVNFVNKLTQEDKHDRTVSQKLKILDYTVKKLINILQNENIESLSDSYDVKGYVNGEDGTTIIFEIYSNNRQRIYAYWEPENDYYQKGDIIEVKNVRHILKAIKEEIDLDKLFSNFTNNLDPGTYDLGGIIMEKK